MTLGLRSRTFPFASSTHAWKTADDVGESIPRFHSRPSPTSGITMSRGIRGSNSAWIIRPGLPHGRERTSWRAVMGADSDACSCREPENPGSFTRAEAHARAAPCLGGRGGAIRTADDGLGEVPPTARLLDAEPVADQCQQCGLLDLHSSAPRPHRGRMYPRRAIRDARPCARAPRWKASSHVEALCRPKARSRARARLDERTREIGGRLELGALSTKASMLAAVASASTSSSAAVATTPNRLPRSDHVRRTDRRSTTARTSKKAAT